MKRITILTIVVVAVIVLWSGAWLYAASLIRQNVTALASANAQTEPRLTCARLDVGGYPFWFDVTCGDMAVTSGDLTANVANVQATLLVYDPFHLLIRATAPLTLEDAFTGSRQRLDWKSLEASARLAGSRIARISVIADTLALSDTVGGEVPLAKAAEAELHLIDDPAGYDAAKGLAALKLYAKLDDLNAPGLQVNDAKSTFDAEITNIPDDVRKFGDSDLLKTWRAAGGKLTINGFKGDDGPDNFNVVGALALDSGAHPAGQLTIQSKGLVDRFGTLVPEQWRGAVLGAPAADGSYSQVLNFTNGVIFSGILPLGAAPALY